MSLADDIQTVLAADVSLAMILTGGVHTGREMTRQDMPTAFDANGEILPCALVKTEVELAWGPFRSSSRAYLRVFLYQRDGYAAIEAARERIFSLLHRQKLSTEYNTWEFMHADDVGGQEDPALSCSLAVSRYVVHRLRAED